MKEFKIKLTTKQVLKLSESNFLDGWKLITSELNNQHNIDICVVKQ